MVLLGVDDDDTVVAPLGVQEFYGVSSKERLKMTLLIFFTLLGSFLLCDGDHVQFGPS